MFDSFRRKPSEEVRIANRQISSSEEQNMIAQAIDPNAEMAYLEQKKSQEDLVKWQQNLTSELDLLEHDLKREMFDEDKCKWVIIEEGMKPACNETCIQMIRTVVRPLMSRNMMMSNFNEIRILQILKRSMQTIVRNLCTKHEDYDIKFLDISYILGTIKNYVIPAPFRALNDGERKHNREIVRRIETHTDRGEEDGKKRGLFFNRR